MNKRVCDIIIDSGSSKNIISKAMVTKLGLQTSKHPVPYKICWIKHSTEVKVIEVCHIKFSIGKNYADEVTCELDGLKKAHVRDGAVVQYLVWLDKQVTLRCNNWWIYFWLFHPLQCGQAWTQTFTSIREIFFNLMPNLVLNMQIQESYGASGYFLEGQSANKKKNL